MSSSLRSALEQLDRVVEALQSQLDCLNAAMQVDEEHLTSEVQGLRELGDRVREQIHAERPQATWNDREELENLVHDLEIAAEARLNEQRRAKLLDLAAELDAGTIKHRFESRSAALDKFRQGAVAELRREAESIAPVKELPGPDANEWLPWACLLQETTDAAVLADLRRDFETLERFTGEIEIGYWSPGVAVKAAPGPTLVTTKVAATANGPRFTKSSGPLAAQRAGVGA